MWNSKEMNKLHTQHLYRSSISTQRDDVIKWKKIRVTGPLCEELTRSFDIFWARINAWVNNRETGDLNRHRTHYDVIAMDCQLFQNDIIDLGLLQTVW